MLGYLAASGATRYAPERVRRSGMRRLWMPGMRRLWMSLLLVPVIAAAVPTAASAQVTAPAARTAMARVLQPGMSSAAVKALQRRLAALKYYPGTIDGQFGTNTLEAVWAFYEVQGLTPHNYVSATMK